MAEPRKIRMLASAALAVGGAALLAYGLLFNAAMVSSAEESAEVSAASETALIREVTIGGLERDERGRLKKTYTGQAPSSCPT